MLQQFDERNRDLIVNIIIRTSSAPKTKGKENILFRRGSRDRGRTICGSKPSEAIDSATSACTASGDMRSFDVP